MKYPQVYETVSNCDNYDKYLVGGWVVDLPLWTKMKVKWDYHSHILWKNKNHVPNHQPDTVSVRIWFVVKFWLGLHSSIFLACELENSYIWPFLAIGVPQNRFYISMKLCPHSHLPHTLLKQKTLRPYHYAMIAMIWSNDIHWISHSL